MWERTKKRCCLVHRTTDCHLCATLSIFVWTDENQNRVDSPLGFDFQTPHTPTRSNGSNRIWLCRVLHRPMTTDRSCEMIFFYFISLGVPSDRLIVPMAIRKLISTIKINWEKVNFAHTHQNRFVETTEWHRQTVACQLVVAQFARVNDKNESKHRDCWLNKKSKY